MAAAVGGEPSARATGTRSTAQEEKDLAALEALVKVLDVEEEGRLLAALRAAFDKYRSIDREVLTLGAEH